MFGRLKNWRRIATRYDRCARTFFSTTCIAASVTVWLSYRGLSLGLFSDGAGISTDTRTYYTAAHPGDLTLYIVQGLWTLSSLPVKTGMRLTWQSTR